MLQSKNQIAKYVSSCLQLAILLEVSTPKPGNVTRNVGFQNTCYEHFLASAVAVEPSFTKAAMQGIRVFDKSINLSEIGIGKIVKNAIISVNNWQHGGNTLLGTILLLTPISAAAGMTLMEQKNLSIPKLREKIKKIVMSTTPSDAIATYDAINIANPSGLINKTQTLDVNDPRSRNEIVKKNITLYDIFGISASYDSISREWIDNYSITFETGLPYLKNQLEKTDCITNAIIHTFLKILSMFPDTLIARKVGLKKANYISTNAEKILKSGGLTTSIGRKMFQAFDEELRNSTNQLNPGATADLISATLAIVLLNGYRP